MPRTRSPRRGTLQFWHRQRAKRMTARIRCWAPTKETKALGFAGYKAGMSHLMVIDNNTHSPTNKEEIQMPVTVIECPPMRVIAITFYKQNEKGYGITLTGQTNAESVPKELSRTLRIPKTKTKKDFKPEELSDVRLLCATQPKLIGLKKKPEILEISIGGAKIEEKIKYANTILGKEISAKDTFVEGQLLDTHAVTKGKGFQGPVKRHGVNLRQHKSEKVVRGPGNVGPWTGNRSWTVAHAGQTGFWQRLEHNKWLIKLGTNPAEINPKGGFVRYGLIKSQYILVKGSVAGPSKRLITFTQPIRPNKKVPKEAPTIVYTSRESKQK